MTLAEAIDTLRKHNAWRMGEALLFVLPSKITEAIRLVCDAAEATLRKDETIRS